MSDGSQGPGWWLASDGKWYSPERAPQDEGAQSSQEPAADGRPPWWKKAVPLWLVLVIAVLALGLGAATTSNNRDETTAWSSTTNSEPAQPNDSRRSITSTTARKTTTIPSTTTTVATTTTSTEPERPGFGPGTQMVDTDVQPGLYIATGVSFCYWERLSGVSGEFDDILANDNASDQAIVDIAASDVAFNSRGCGRWELYEATGAPADSFGEGDWVVGEQIQPGRYRADVDSSCYWERAAGFGHVFGEIVANDNVQQGSAIVEISPNDRRFTSRGCGTWRGA